MTETGQTGNPTPEGQASAAGNAAASGWQAKFQTPEAMWEAYRTQQSTFDKKVAELSTKGQTPAAAAAAPTDEYDDFYNRFDSEMQSGTLSDSTKAQLKTLGMSEARALAVYETMVSLDYAPLKEHFQGDIMQAAAIANKSMSAETKAAFNALRAAGEYQTAAALLTKAVNAAGAATKAPDIKVGTVAVGTGAGFKDFPEVIKAQQDPRNQYDKDYQANFTRTWQATPQALREEWARLYNSGRG